MSEGEWEDEEPRRDRFGEDEDDGFYRSRQAPPSGAVTTVGVVNIILGVLSGMCGFCIFGGVGILATGMEEFRRHPQIQEFFREFPGLEGVLIIILVMMGGFALLLTVLHLTAGIGILNRKNWARILGLVLAGLAMLASCLGIFATIQALANPRPNSDPAITAVLFLLNVAYVVLSFVVLLNPKCAREFR